MTTLNELIILKRRAEESANRYNVAFHDVDCSDEQCQELRVSYEADIESYDQARRDFRKTIVNLEAACLAARNRWITADKAYWQAYLPEGSTDESKRLENHLDQMLSEYTEICSFFN